MKKHTIFVIAHDIRSTHNVGSLLRTAEGLGVDHVYITGYTPYPIRPNDNRLPHIARKLDAQIHKTALGAELQQSWSFHEDINQLLIDLKNKGVRICALEQSAQSIPLASYTSTGDVAVILGREVDGISTDIIALCDDIIEIPMFGQKESFNVVQAAAMTLFQLRFHS